jgi:hypothetical protein
MSGQFASAGRIRQLVSNDYCEVSFDPATLIVRFVRTSVPIRSLEEASRFFGQAVSVIDTLGRSRIKLIIDLRQGPNRNDPEYETAMAEHRRDIANGIRRIAVIVQSAAGKLQVQRLGKEDHIDQLIVSDEATAIAHLTG